MSVVPLTHHEILELVEPFTRCGRHVDLAASDRLERRLVFKALAHSREQSGQQRLREHLQLDLLVTGTCRLTRTLRLDSGLQATLTAMGPEPGALLARVEAVAPFDQFTCGPGFEIARSYELAYAAGTGAARPTRALVRATAILDGLKLSLNVSTVRGVPAEILLEPPAGAQRLELPEDLLAVLGWDWVSLIRTPAGYKTKLRLRGGVERRTRNAELALEQAARHLVQTLAEPPGRFHERWLRARWGVVFRRSIPMLTLAALIGTIAALPHFIVAGNPGLWLLLFHLPTALIALSFCLQEQAQYEIPPRPRRAAEAAWFRLHEPPRAAAER